MAQLADGLIQTYEKGQSAFEMFKGLYAVDPKIM